MIFYFNLKWSFNTTYSYNCQLHLRFNWFFSSDIPELEYLGCWIDNPIKQRVLSDFYSNHRDKDLDWNNLGETSVLKCASDAVNSCKEYNLFAVENFGECYSQEGYPDYKNMKAAPNSCVNGTSTYQFVTDWLTFCLSAC